MMHTTAADNFFQIILVGDSAGANLCLALLSHAMHPHPDQSIPRIDLNDDTLCGTLLVSPWVVLNTNAASMTANAQTDLWSGPF